MSIPNSEIRSIPLALLDLSSTPMQVERRKYRTKEEIRQLAGTLKSVGLIHPIVVRFHPHPKAGEEAYEIIAGEGRFLAAKEAGFQDIRADVRDLDDSQVEEVQLIENLQRTGLHELVEAEGYEQLHKRKLSAEEIGERVGKSKAYVYGRMKLLALCKEARQVFRDGELSASHFLLLARIPNEAQQKEALRLFRKGRWGGEPMSYRDAAKHVQDTYMLRLSAAGFKTEDASLVPSAGTCGACPKRTGNQPELFGDVKGADVCTDPPCFRQKIAAHAERAIAAAKDGGQKVLAGAEAKKVARYGVESQLTGFVRLDARDYSTGKKTYRQTLGKDYVPTLLQDPDSGKMIEVAPSKDVDKAHGNKERSSNDAYSKRQAAERTAAERKHRAEIAYRLALFKAVRDASGKRKALTRRELELAAERLLDRLEHDSKKRLFAAIGWEAKKKGYSTNFDPPTPIGKMSDEELAQLIRDASLASELQVWQHSGDSKATALEAAAAALDVDAKRIRRDLTTAAAAKAAKKSPAPASKKAKRK